VFRSLQINLALPFVLPLLDPIRALAAEIENTPRPSAPLEGDALLEWSRSQPARGELNGLLALFPPGFSVPGSNGVITVSANEASAVLRACTLLRLHLWQRDLAAFPEAGLESGLDYKRYTGEQQRVVMCYLFLATLQEVILKHCVRPPVFSNWGRWLQRVQAYFSPLRADYVEPPKWTADTEVPATDESWQVVVHNDPLNLMSYVMAVFETTLSLRPEIAQQRMLEVHQAKRSIVYQGSRQKAEAQARALRGWHLKAEARARG
jgi:ATP-dependent Clp protease adaptor protein ClpS